jgi:hypothetical protein
MTAAAFRASQVERCPLCGASLLEALRPHRGSGAWSVLCACPGCRAELLMVLSFRPIWVQEAPETVAAAAGGAR